MNKTMALLLIAILLLTGSATLLAGGKPQLQAGTKSVFYGFEGLSNMGIDGSSIGGMYFIKDRIAPFVGIGFGHKKDKPGDDQPEETINKLDIGAGVCWYAMQKGSTAFYLAPQIWYGSESSETSVMDSPVKSSKGILQLACSISVEWWATESISFWGGVTIGYEHSKETDENGAREIERTSSTIGFIDTAPGIGIGFYF